MRGYALAEEDIEVGGDNNNMHDCNQYRVSLALKVSCSGNTKCVHYAYTCTVLRGGMRTSHTHVHFQIAVYINKKIPTYLPIPILLA